MRDKLALWFVFSVLLSLVPIIFHIVKGYTNHTPHALTAAIQRGELLLITAALCAAAVGELIVAQPITPPTSSTTITSTTSQLTAKPSQIDKIVSGGTAIIFLMFCSLYFADISATYNSGAYVNNKIIVITSISLFFRNCM
jgi:hypothetical protein